MGFGEYRWRQSYFRAHPAPPPGGNQCASVLPLRRGPPRAMGATAIKAGERLCPCAAQCARRRPLARPVRRTPIY
jgi:hypothetical protein